MLPTTIINNYLQLLTTEQVNMIFIKGDIYSKEVYILFYKHSMLLVDSSAPQTYIYRKHCKINI